MSLKQCRLNAGRTVDEVANALQISRQAVYQWERGEAMPTASNLVKLAGLYCCTVDNLIMPEESKCREDV